MICILTSIYVNENGIWCYSNYWIMCGAVRFLIRRRLTWTFQLYVFFLLFQFLHDISLGYATITLLKLLVIGRFTHNISHPCHLWFWTFCSSISLSCDYRKVSSKISFYQLLDSHRASVLLLGMPAPLPLKSLVSLGTCWALTFLSWKPSQRWEACQAVAVLENGLSQMWNPLGIWCFCCNSNSVSFILCET